MIEDILEIFIAMLVCLGIAGLLGLVLALADKFLKVKEDPRIEEVTKMLPGANCGGCGFPGCSGFATALVKGESTTLNPCKVSKQEAKEKIKQYLHETPGPDGKTVDVK